MATTAVIAIAAVGAGASAYSSRETGKKQEAAANKQTELIKEEQLRLQQQEQADREAAAGKEAQSQAQAQVKRRRNPDVFADRGGTVLTSPLGVPGQQQSPRSTLLGS
jgi:hypothetical protein